MEYRIRRTSDFCGDDKPCEEAYRKTVPTYDIRTCTEVEYDAKFALRFGKWKDDGTEHTTTKYGYIKRRLKDREVWCVNISSLEQLNSLCEKYGDIIVRNANERDMATIEIYDDYRE